MNAVTWINEKYSKKKIPQFKAGDTIKVHVKIIEGEKERIQVYEGVVIKIHRAGLSSSFTVRKISYGVGVERVFPYYSPVVSKIEVVTRGKIRRAKLYYLRDLRGKAARISALDKEGGSVETAEPELAKPIEEDNQSVSQESQDQAVAK